MTTVADLDALVLTDGPAPLPFFAALGDSTVGAHLLRWLAGEGVRRVVVAIPEDTLAAADLPLVAPPDLDVLATPHTPGLPRAEVLRAVAPHLLSDPVVVVDGDALYDLDLAVALSRYRQLNVKGTEQPLVLTSPDGEPLGCLLLGSYWLRNLGDRKDLPSGMPLTTARERLSVATPEGLARARALPVR